MTAPPHNSRIDIRTRLRRGETEDSTVSCKELLPDLNAGERPEKVSALEGESAIIIRRHEADVMNEKCEEMLRESVASILNTLITEAQAGNMQAAKFIIDRTLPDPRDARVKFDLREIEGR